MESDLRLAAGRLRSARRVFVITGAGISAESGVPTFRGAGGWWREHRAEDLASPEGFARAPVLVWTWYGERRRNLLAVEPNAGHRALVEIERRMPGFLLVTQNVDGLHQRAGSHRVAALHGDIWATRCLACGDRRREPGRVFDSLPPRCEACGGMLRPDIVWFGEMLPAEPLAAIDAFLGAGAVDLALVIGTSALFGYIAHWAGEAQAAGALLVEINPEETPLSGRCDIHLRGPSGEILPRLLGV